MKKKKRLQNNVHFLEKQLKILRIWELINYISNSQLDANMGQVSDQAWYSGVERENSCFSFCCSLEEYIIQGKDSFLIDPEQKLLYPRQKFAK